MGSKESKFGAQLLPLDAERKGPDFEPRNLCSSKQIVLPMNQKPSA